jgi:hypothetical protein
MNDNSRLYDPIRKQSSYDPFAFDSWKNALKEEEKKSKQQYHQPQQNQRHQNTQYSQPRHQQYSREKPPLYPNTLQVNNDRQQKQQSSYVNHPNYNKNSSINNNKNQNDFHFNRQQSRFTDFKNTSMYSPAHNIIDNQERYNKFNQQRNANTHQEMDSRMNIRQYNVPTSVNSNYVDFSYKNKNNMKLNKKSQLSNIIYGRNRIFDTQVNYNRHMPVPIDDLKPVNTSSIDFN